MVPFILMSVKPQKIFIIFITRNLTSFLKKFIFGLKKKKKHTFIPQPDYIGRYNPRLLTKKDGWIDWSQSSEEIVNFINAFDDPYEGASTMIGMENVGLKKHNYTAARERIYPFMSGLVLRNDKNWIVVVTRDNNCLIIEKVLDSKNKNIINKIRPGQRFFTLSQKLITQKVKELSLIAKVLK